MSRWEAIPKKRIPGRLLSLLRGLAPAADTDALIPTEETVLVKEADIPDELLQVTVPPMDWLWATYVLPHIDEGYPRDEVFLTLVLEGKHVFGDEDHLNKTVMTPGDLFVVEPLRVHWLFSGISPEINSPAYFAALQWQIPRNMVDSVSRELAGWQPFMAMGL